MKRLHVHVSVENLATSIEFYKALFAAEPTVVKSDYAKWMLEDPRVNFAISERGGTLGVRHLGIQAEDRTELAEILAHAKRAANPMTEQRATTCCYAESETGWTVDPQGVPWEAFLTTGESTTYGDAPTSASQPGGCCGRADDGRRIAC